MHFFYCCIYLNGRLGFYLEGQGSGPSVCWLSGLRSWRGWYGEQKNVLRQSAVIP
jgi:hypothetical protein